MGLDEFALCVRRENLPLAWLSDSVALPIQWDDLTFMNGHFEFHCRREIETDFTWKQIIPYVLSVTEDNLLLTYQRHGTEKRLHGLWSAGIGGHINQDDADSVDFREILMKGMLRECREELGIGDLAFSLLGIINEEQTTVGNAHLGLVFTTTIPSHLPMSSELSNWKFVSREQIKSFNFELWSSLALQLLGRNRISFL